MKADGERDTSESVPGWIAVTKARMGAKAEKVDLTSHAMRVVSRERGIQNEDKAAKNKSACRRAPHLVIWRSDSGTGGQIWDEAHVGLDWQRSRAEIEHSDRAMRSPLEWDYSTPTVNGRGDL